MRDKAFRRFQEEKKKIWAKQAGREWYREAPSPKQVGMLAHTPKACSCWMCGNPRRYFKDKTIQEKRLENGKIDVDNRDVLL